MKKFSFCILSVFLLAVSSCVKEAGPGMNPDGTSRPTANSPNSGRTSNSVAIKQTKVVHLGNQKNISVDNKDKGNQENTVIDLREK